MQAHGRGPQGEFEAQYHYDALSRRSRKAVRYKGKTEQTTRFLWQGYRLLQEQRDDGSRRSWSYDPASPWSPLAALEQAGDSRSADIYWYHTDLNSAPLEVTDAAGNLCWSGQYQDDESGLHYNLFRYYEPEVGRFTTQDPIGLEGGLNLYQYAPNPLMWVDPFGLTCSHSAKNPKQAHAAIKDKWGHDMTPKEMKELHKTVDNIKLNRPAYARDGIEFENSYRISPNSQRLDTGSGPYREWTVKTPGVGNRGTRRIVVDKATGKAYYSHDHYDSFIEIDLSGWK
ncbi:RHS domain-containing protein [Serratia marcescens]|nr:RHS domain-containing protein [Serratia marcescens]